MTPTRIDPGRPGAGRPRAGASARAGEPRWKQHTINGKSEFEAAGRLRRRQRRQARHRLGRHLVSRPPTGRPYHVRDVARQGTYYNCFATLPMDVNGDGKTDFVTCSLLRQERRLGREPGRGRARTWTYHEIDLPGTSEAAVAGRPDGDGKPDVLPNSTNVVVWYELAKAGPKPDVEEARLRQGGRRPRRRLGRRQRRRPGRPAHAQGLVRGPVRPAAPTTWAWHPDWQLGADRHPDPRPRRRRRRPRPTSSTAWATTTASSGSSRARAPAASGPGPSTTIDKTIASVHTLLWADLDGDGKADELVTGKRVYAHEIEPGATDGSVIAWYRSTRTPKAWTRHVIFQGEPAKNAPAKAARPRRPQGLPRPAPPAPASR